MHPRIEELFTLLETHRSTLERAVAEVPPELRDRRPAAARWSVAELLEHLALVEERVTRGLTAELEKAKAAGLGPERETSSVASMLDIALILDRSVAREAMEFVQPRSGLTADVALERLAERRKQLLATVAAADGLALGEVTAMNPVLGPLNVYQWLIFVAGHEARHTAQLRECGAALRSGATA